MIVRLQQEKDNTLKYTYRGNAGDRASCKEGMVEGNQEGTVGHHRPAGVTEML